MTEENKKTSTPVIHHLKDRFIRKVDSFSFDNVDPLFSSTSDSSTFIKEEIRKYKLQQAGSESSLSLEASSSNRQQEKEKSTTIDQQKRNWLQLRSGKRIFKRRSRSLENKIEVDVKFVSENKNGENSEKILKMAVSNFSRSEIIQLVNNVPFLWGEENTDILSEVNLFIKCIQNINVCLSEKSDKQFLLALLGTRLRGRAAELLSNSSCDDFDGFKSLIYDRIVNIKPYHVQVNELRTSKQLPSETVRSFGKKIKTALELCKVKAKQKHNGDTRLIEVDLDETATLAFKSGLFNPALRFFAWQNSNSSLDELISKIGQLEESESSVLNDNMNMFNSNNLYRTLQNDSKGVNFNDLNRNKMFNYNKPQFENNYNTTNRNNYSNFSQNKNQNFSQNNTHKNFQQNKFQQNGYQNNNNVKCGFCGKLYHNYAECRLRKSTPFCTICKMYGHNSLACPTSQKNKVSINPIQDNRKNYRPAKCEFCQRLGHTAENCFAKKHWDAKHQNNDKNKNQNTFNKGN